jgi:hypothetical protein
MSALEKTFVQTSLTSNVIDGRTNGTTRSALRVGPTYKPMRNLLNTTSKNLHRELAQLERCHDDGASYAGEGEELLTEECDNGDDDVGDHEEEGQSEFTDQYAQGELAAEEGCQAAEEGCQEGAEDYMFGCMSLEDLEGCQAEGEGCSSVDSSFEYSRSDCSSPSSYMESD